MTSVTGKIKSLTFMEILLVIIILGILLGISLPAFKNTFHSLQLNSVSSDLQALMDYLRGRAIVEGKVIYFNIDNAKKECWAQIKDAPIRLKTYPLPDDIKIETAQKQIIFYPDGHIDGVTIKLTSLNNQSVILTTKGLYGRIKLQTQQ